MQEPFGAYTWYPVNDQPVRQGLLRRADLRAAAAWWASSTGSWRAGARRRSARSLGGTWPARRRRTSRRSPSATTCAHRDRGPHNLPITYWVPRGDQSTLSELRRTPKMIKWLEKRLGPLPVRPHRRRRRAELLRDGDPDAGHDGWAAAARTTARGLPGRPAPRVRPPVVRRHGHAGQLDRTCGSTSRSRCTRRSAGRSPAAGRPWPVARAARPSSDNDSRASDGPPGAYHPQEFGDICVYYCGALMLDRLRTKVGVSTFNAIWKGWPQKHRFASVDRSDVHRLGQRPRRPGPRPVPHRLADLAHDPRRLTTPVVDPTHRSGGVSGAGSPRRGG